ncbi:hypothetical protein G7B40_024520 [Aetokthonos hydrillicola Thurmond2011]|uniref:Uncharacterized protein n=1 Tax=Aetokthonos hydrillicola Thurmond2011 TaxID=2712845 RepID=A0AAP5MBA2_9CYAN|nr:hypothetical protein [Aetokthonos hydrillicola]MBO3463893.1 hypothetical protein [Aetokthonos hydrillicola CCALA 1050]MBW4586100.1 hypothetical protein [Aetokthonos hydrillicola CCALA 1050]MDR9897707.1 hypothetical protein [Aetokthonos hydrillicola Thurmond2011]
MDSKTSVVTQTSQIVNNTDKFIGKTVTIRSVPIDKIGTSSFTVAPSTVTIHEGETVVVYGEVRPFVVTTIDRDYHLTWDLNVRKQLEKEYTNKPVLIAETIYPST